MELEARNKLATTITAGLAAPNPDLTTQIGSAAPGNESSYFGFSGYDFEQIKTRMVHCQLQPKCIYNTQLLHTETQYFPYNLTQH